MKEKFNGNREAIFTLEKKGYVFVEDLATLEYWPVGGDKIKGGEFIEGVDCGMLIGLMFDVHLFEDKNRVCESVQCSKNDVRENGV